MDKTQGIIMFNRGDKMLVRILVCLYTLRKYYKGEITFYIEDPCSCTKQLIKALEYFNCDVIKLDEKHEYKTLVRKNSLFQNPPYDKTLWIDTDTLIVGSINEMFDYLDEKNVDLCIPSFCGWMSSGKSISKRIKNFENIAEDRHISKALDHYPAVNTGILSFKKSSEWTKFVSDWTDLAHKGSLNKIFIPDEVACQILYPSMEEWGLKYFIAPQKFNVSVKYGLDVEDKRIIHAHGQKHCLDFGLCYLWKDVFEKMRKDNIANINYFVENHPDKRLKKYLNNDKDVTIVTACDEQYVDILRETFPNWRKYKNLDEYPVIVFVHGIDQGDERLDFLKLPNVRIIPWSMDNADSHREEMLSAFVFGAAENVQTEFWFKFDADSYATDKTPFVDEEMKGYAFCGHRWSYSKTDHIKQLDEWAKGHWKRKLKKAPPMIEEGRIDGRRFFHKTKRTISFAQLHKTKFTKFCVSLLKEKKLPAPTQDTFMFYVANRFDPETVGTKNFKKNMGFAQGNGRRGVEDIRKRLAEVEAQWKAKDVVENPDKKNEETKKFNIPKDIHNPGKSGNTFNTPYMVPQNEESQIIIKKEQKNTNTVAPTNNVQTCLIRGVWGDIGDNGIRNGKMRKDIEAIKSNPYCSINDFKVYVFGTDNFKMLTDEGFACELVCGQPVKYDMEQKLYRHKLDILHQASNDFDEIVFLDWDCVPVKKLPDNFWEKMREKAPFQANLFQYRTKKCLWRNSDWRKVCNGGFIYLRDNKISEDFIKNYNEFSEWVEKRKTKRQAQGKTLRFREKALIFDDEPSMSKWVDDYMGGWKGPEAYWDKFEPIFCNLKNKSAYPQEKLDSKPSCFLHWG